MITKQTRSARRGWATRYARQLSQKLEKSGLVKVEQISSVIEILTKDNKTRDISLSTKANLNRLKKFANADIKKLDNLIVNRVNYMTVKEKTAFKQYVKSDLGVSKASLAISSYEGVSEFYLEYKDEIKNIYNNSSPENHSKELGDLYENSIAKQNSLELDAIAAGIDVFG